MSKEFAALSKGKGLICAVTEEEGSVLFTSQGQLSRYAFYPAADRSVAALPPSQLYSTGQEPAYHQSIYFVLLLDEKKLRIVKYYVIEDEVKSDSGWLTGRLVHRIPEFLVTRLTCCV